MNIRIFSTLTAGVYKVTVKTEDWSEGDKDLMQRYGEPVIDVGSAFTGTVPYVAFTLPTRTMRVMSESPFTERFDFRDTADAEDRANAWKTAVVARITDAVAILRSNEDTFTREDVLTL